MNIIKALLESFRPMSPNTEATAPSVRGGAILERGSQQRNAMERADISQRKFYVFPKQSLMQKILNAFNVVDQRVSNLSDDQVRSLNVNQLIELAKRQGGKLPTRYVLALSGDQITSILELRNDHKLKISPETKNLIDAMAGHINDTWRPDDLPSQSPETQAAFLHEDNLPKLTSKFLEALDFKKILSVISVEKLNSILANMTPEQREAVEINLGRHHVPFPSSTVGMADFKNIEQWTDHMTRDYIQLHYPQEVIGDIPIYIISGLRVEQISYFTSEQLDALADAGKLKFLDPDALRQLNVNQRAMFTHYSEQQLSAEGKRVFQNE